MELAESLREIDLTQVDTVEDFAVELRDMEDAGKIVHYTSGRFGELAWFPAWEHADRDMRHFTASDVPFGSRDEPYDDADEGWRIVIFEQGGYVYILEDDRPKGTRFPRRWRVERDQYFRAWALVLHFYNAPVPLDDIEEEDEQ